MAENTNGATNGQANPQQGQAQLSLQRIYIKDVSFEAPGAPQIFQQAGQPNVELNLSADCQSDILQNFLAEAGEFAGDLVASGNQ